jgi:hypothetical protein
MCPAFIGIYSLNMALSTFSFLVVGEGGVVQEALLKNKNKNVDVLVAFRLTLLK